VAHVDGSMLVPTYGQGILSISGDPNSVLPIEG
jgi:hypothetical protein